MAAAKLIRVYWRDIPAQVMAKRGRESARAMLSQRFQQAIDRAAMRAGKAGSDAYLEEWRREAEPCGDDLQAAVDAAAAEFEAQFSDADLDVLAKARGVRQTEG